MVQDKRINSSDVFVILYKVVLLLTPSYKVHEKSSIIHSIDCRSHEHRVYKTNMAMRTKIVRKRYC